MYKGKNAVIGFTLLEILVVLLIIGIVASLGMVNYNNLRQQQVGREISANLKLIAAAEKILRMEEGNYVFCGNTTAVNSNLKLAIPTGDGTANANYTVTTLGNTFNASGVERVGGRTWWINETMEEPLD